MYPGIPLLYPAVFLHLPETLGLINLSIPTPMKPFCRCGKGGNLRRLHGFNIQSNKLHHVPNLIYFWIVTFGRGVELVHVAKSLSAFQGRAKQNN